MRAFGHAHMSGVRMSTESFVLVEGVSPKSRTVAAVLCFFLGALGIHRFYVGKVGTGVLMIVTLGGLGIWALIDFIMILVGSFKDIEGRTLTNWG